MLRHIPRNSVRNLALSASRLQAGAVKDGRKLSPEEAKAEAAKLALQSLKDVGSLFSSGNDDAVQPIDTAPIYEDPSLFGHLNLLHQGQVLKELQDKYDKNWNKLTDQDKKLGYYIAYGNWGPREKFTNWNTLEAPFDLPFVIPLKISKTSPQPTDVIHKLERVILAETPVRKDEFDTSRMDAVTKTFIYLTVFVMIVAIARDKNTGEAGKPKEIVVEDVHEMQRREHAAAEAAKAQAEAEAAAIEAQAKQSRKWYYLWLK
ncbi:CIC11C00000001234 [Sungouiella intermedia]|uniref:CIC11C00000001234 n=1 Tax=Sungouiella intermedia TaxID=45354 RepID=A0A1L0DNH2_9ASCO|nr:CIC11C00000001234 [[Candida] intermedia]